jgi:hypothetical protein
MNIKKTIEAPLTIYYFRYFGGHRYSIEAAITLILPTSFVVRRSNSWPAINSMRFVFKGILPNPPKAGQMVNPTKLLRQHQALKETCHA